MTLPNAGHTEDLGVTASASQETAQPAAEGPRQWTREDVRNASPAEVMAAMKAGLLTDLGMPQHPRRR